MTDLIDFLEARISDDEQTARAAICPCGGPVCTVELGWMHRSEAISRLDSPGVADHVVAWSPARVLAECATKRALIAITESWGHLTVEDCWYSCAVSTGEDACCDDARAANGECDCGRDYRVKRVLAALAAPYASHPEFQPEWGQL